MMNDATSDQKTNCDRQVQEKDAGGERRLGLLNALNVLPAGENCFRTGVYSDKDTM